MVVLRLVKTDKEAYEEREQATKEFMRLLDLAKQYLIEAEKLQIKYDIDISNK